MTLIVLLRVITTLLLLIGIIITIIIIITPLEQAKYRTVHMHTVCIRDISIKRTTAVGLDLFSESYQSAMAFDAEKAINDICG